LSSDHEKSFLNDWEAKSGSPYGHLVRVTKGKPVGKRGNDMGNGRFVGPERLGVQRVSKTIDLVCAHYATCRPRDNSPISFRDVA